MKTTLDEAFDQLNQAILNVNCYRTIYKNPKSGSTLSDKFGTIKFLDSSTTSWNSSKEAHASNSWIIYDGVARATIDSLPNNAEYINLRNDIGNNAVYKSGVESFVSSYVSGARYVLGRIFAPRTLILPYSFRGTIYIVPNSTGIFERGLYLNSVGTNIPFTEGWIDTTAHIDQTGSNIYKATVDFDSGYSMSPMYLNRLYLSTTTFQNLANKLGTVTNGELYLGSKNIANMTTAQKTAITAKGWTIY